jgi:prefoldin alpha subunit
LTRNCIDLMRHGHWAQNVEQAKSYFKRKVKFVTEQMEKIQMLGIEKSNVRDGETQYINLHC